MGDLAQQFARGLDAGAEAGAPAWLAALRERGARQFGTHGLPGPGVEHWKYTSLRALERRSPTLGTGGGSPGTGALAEPLLADVPRAVLVDGDFSLLDGVLPEGVTVVPLGEALLNGAEDLRQQLGSLQIEARGDGFSALNTATLKAGALIQVAAGVDAGPLLLHWLSASDDALFNARICVLLEAGARLELLEQFENAPDRHPMLNLVLQGRLERGARLHHARLQAESARSVLVSRTAVQVGADGHYDFTGLDLGGALVRLDVEVHLNGEGAGCSLHGACLARGRSHVDHHLDVQHHSPDCTSNQLFRGVLDDRSRAVFNGRVYVAEGADGTEARQSSAGLLLSPHAEIDAKPELEILADEVVASHGATVGQLDDNALFYLRSRGIDTATAQGLLTHAFCRSVVDAMPEGAARAALAGRLEAALQRRGIGHE